MKVRNPDGSLANIPNPNKASVTMLASLPAALIDPTTLSVSDAIARHSCTKAGQFWMIH